MTIAALTVAAEPVRFWWAAPLVTLAAVVLAFGTSIGALRLQRRALEDNRELRVTDDVREVLGDALRDMHSVCRALEDAKDLVQLNKQRARIWKALDAVEIPVERFDRLNRELTELQSEMRARRRAADDAFAGLQLQSERLGLLLGLRHPLFLDHMFGILLNLGGVTELEMWNLPVFDDDGTAAASAERERQQLNERAVELIEDLREAGHAYVEEHRKIKTDVKSGSTTHA